MTAELEIARRFYGALQARDVKDLLALLHPDFRGHVTAGLPAGLGGTYDGPEAMLMDCWGRAAQIFQARPEPEQFFVSEGGWVIVRGSYGFSPRASGEARDAAFAHFLHFRERRLVELWQVTDSRRWEQAIGSEVVRRLFRTVEERDLETMFELYDHDVVISESPSLPYGGEYRGHDGVVAHGLGYLGTWGPVQGPGDEVLDPEFIDAGDRVFVHWRQKATAPSGEHVDFPALSEYHLRDGKIIASTMHQFDTDAILRFLERAAAGP